jgi:hypothetical protein
MTKSFAVPILALTCLLGAFVAPAVARDRDGDRLPDRWERHHDLSTKKKSGKGDPDRDRLSNRREFHHRLNPHRADTDRDGLRDRAELRRYKTDPRGADTDHDGVKDGAEVRAGTDPRKRNSRPPGNGGNANPSPTSPGASAAGGFPTPSSTGVPAGWAPKQTRTSELRITQPGAVVEDVLLQNANIVVSAPNVTIRRVKMQGGWINNNQGSTCANGLTVEDTTIEPPPGAASTTESEGVISYGGYTARRVKIVNRSEGFRVSGKPACGEVRIENSFEKIVIPSGRCDLHADGIQGYYGSHVSVVNTTIDFSQAACGTAAFFVPGNQGNTSASIDRLLVMGGGYPVRMGVPGSVSGLKIVDGSWQYGPIFVGCSRLSGWDASIVKINADYQVASTVRAQPCNTQGDG